ncbi:hypothetical protein G6F37_007673 [Rhizopus arrhizus]|nr:hypothetical protein G6F38_006839 [Rhizopus arrhizus]KAG1156366.1 hypothetical protein G6F37_007673 [Rhizopus arrhizus]
MFSLCISTSSPSYPVILIWTTKAVSNRIGPLLEPYTTYVRSLLTRYPNPPQSHAPFHLFGCTQGTHAVHGRRVLSTRSMNTLCVQKKQGDRIQTILLKITSVLLEKVRVPDHGPPEKKIFSSCSDPTEERSKVTQGPQLLFTSDDGHIPPFLVEERHVDIVIWRAKKQGREFHNLFSVQRLNTSSFEVIRYGFGRSTLMDCERDRLEIQKWELSPSCLFS